MRTGAARVNVPYRWPATLRLPIRPPRLVYLDMNHWINLTRARVGHGGGEVFADAWIACLDAADAGRAAFPLSDSIYFEIETNQNPRQRVHLRETMERLSGFRVVTSRGVIATHEIEALLDELAGPSTSPINPMDYLDWGFARALGLIGGFEIFTENGDDITEQARATFRGGPEAFDALMRDGDLRLNRQVLDGPTPEAVAGLVTDGRDPSQGRKITEKRAQQESEQAERINADPSWRKGRLRDLIAVWELNVELIDILTRGLLDRRTSFADVFVDIERARECFDSLPSFDVAVTLKAGYHRDGRHRWTPNDIHDIDALGSTIPYCDIVVTDKAIANQANISGLSERLETIVISNLSDLETQL